MTVDLNVVIMVLVRLTGGEMRCGVTGVVTMHGV